MVNFAKRQRKKSHAFSNFRVLRSCRNLYFWTYRWMINNAIHTSLDTIVSIKRWYKKCFQANQKSDAHFYIGAVVTNQALQIPKYLSGSQPVQGWEGCSSIMKLYETLVLASWKHEALFQRKGSYRKKWNKSVKTYMLILTG